MNSLPVRLTPFSMVATMKQIAKQELQTQLVSACMPQHNQSLQTLCHLVDDHQSGVAVWAAMAIMHYLASDPRGRRILRNTALCDYDFAAAHALLLYGHVEVTRRARLSQPRMESSCRSSMLQYAEPAQRESQAIISAKRKRNAFGNARPPISNEILDYWRATLCQSDYVNVLQTLITNSKCAAECATRKTIASQSGDKNIAHNRLLHAISASNAIESSQELVRLLQETDETTPKTVFWRRRRSNGTFSYHGNIIRSTNDAQQTSIATCSLAPDEFRVAGNHTAAVWHMAEVQTAPRASDRTCLPGITETIAHMRALETDSSPHPRAKRMRQYSRLKTHLHADIQDGFNSVSITGIARGTILMRAKIPASKSQIEAGYAIAHELAEDMVDARERCSSENLLESASVLATSSLLPVREPFALPGSPLALGLQASEVATRILKDKTHRGNPCRAFTGVRFDDEEEPPHEPENYDMPTPVLTIVDAQVEVHTADDIRVEDYAPPAIRGHRDVFMADATLQITVAGDKPIRVLEAAFALASERHVSASLSRAAQWKLFVEARALLLAGSIQASFVNDLVKADRAGHVNSSTASAKRIHLHDFNLNLFLTVYQAYIGRQSKIPASFPNTPWQAIHPAPFDTGSSGGIGKCGTAWAADKRLACSNVVISQEQVDEFAVYQAKRHFVPVSDTEYSAVPAVARGVPHYGVVGLQEYLSDVGDACENVRGLVDISSRTVDSIQVLPFGPFSERIACSVAETSDAAKMLGARHPPDAHDGEGKGYAPDSTLEGLSIARPPLVQPVSCVNPEDNGFENLGCFLQVALCAASLLACMAKTLARHSLARPIDNEGCLDLLYCLLCAFHAEPNAKVDFAAEGYQTAIDACVLLCVVYPANPEVNNRVVLPAYQKGVQACAEASRKQAERGERARGLGLQGLAEVGAVSKEEAEEARRFWKSFCRKDREQCAWAALRPLLLALMDVDGSLDVSVEELDRVASAFDGAIRGAWLVHSPDGTSPPPPPHPMATARSPTFVAPVHVVPVLVGKQGCDGVRVPARGAAVGIPPCGFHQICSLMLGAARFREERVLVRYTMNYGGVLIRMSSLSDLARSDGTARSDKATSALGIDNDQAQFGTRRERWISTKLQRMAFAANNEALKPLFFNVCKPRPEGIRFRARTPADVNFIKSRRLAWAHQNRVSAEDEEAESAFYTAADEANELGM